eukprot:GHVP01000406.1.p1 GENE.GHVP01000406.1~~GHVP01000406.1.p1  ORF type:complete len:1031 (-),score=162.48 GHVP01000406.1:363-3398(-)
MKKDFLTIEIKTSDTKKLRVIKTNKPEKNEYKKYPENHIRSQRFRWWNFLILSVADQFKNYPNIYFLFEASCKLIPRLRVGYLSTSVGPFAFVIIFSVLRDGYEDYMRYKRDIDLNHQKYTVYRKRQRKLVRSSELHVGDLIWIQKNERVPADSVLLYTTEKSGCSFIRTDQLDGETDWKVRVAVSETQRSEMGIEQQEDRINMLFPEITAESPRKDIYSFGGNIKLWINKRLITEPLDVDNMLWMNTVIASGNSLGCIVYTGNETRAQLNKTKNRAKLSTLETEINRLTVLIATVMVSLSFILTIKNGFGPGWYIYTIRFLMILSAIIPINLKVGIEIGQMFQSYFINNDRKMRGSVTRTRNLATELGRVQYLLTDKTGTLTKNEMTLKRLCVGTLTYSNGFFEDLAKEVAQGYNDRFLQPVGKRKVFRSLQQRLYETVKGLAICHNVTPAFEEDDTMVYHAASPDEVAIVKWANSIGVKLINRNREECWLEVQNEIQKFQILETFPFTSERKRMGIIVKDLQTDEIVFYEKGADVIMEKIVKENNWLEEESGNLAREGLRTLAFGMRSLTVKEYETFSEDYKQAKTAIKDRAYNMKNETQKHLERDLELLAITGVEDKLQDDLVPTLESLKNAGIKIWVLTGDKIETATCIAISSKLVLRGQRIMTVRNLETEKTETFLYNLKTRLDSCLIIDGDSVALIIKKSRRRFIELASKLSCVVCCRCSPTQKAQITLSVKEITKKVVCSIGDGGNDVSMIFASDVGVGIAGKEGMQASLAADFSIERFSYLKRLLLWHGRNSYTQMGSLVLGIIYRGIILSVAQVLYLSSFYMAPVPLFKGFMLIGYVMLYTSFPFISILLDYDVKEETVFLYPELYVELAKGRLLNFKRFFYTLSIGIFQGTVIISSFLLLFSSNIVDIVQVTFSALVVNTILTITLYIHQLSKVHVLLTTIVGLTSYFGQFVFTSIMSRTRMKVPWKLVASFLIVSCAAFIPYIIVLAIKHIFFPEIYRKL